jgi:hypothetical protein
MSDTALTVHAAQTLLTQRALAILKEDGQEAQLLAVAPALERNSPDEPETAVVLSVWERRGGPEYRVHWLSPWNNGLYDGSYFKTRVSAWREFTERILDSVDD